MELKGGIFYCHNLSLDTRHNLDAWKRFKVEKKNWNFHTVVLLSCQNYTTNNKSK